MTGNSSSPGPFWAHIELLRLFLAHREDIVERIESVLNAQRKPIHYLQDRSLLSRLFEDCFFERPAVAPDQKRLRGQLEAAYFAGGFQPRRLPGMHNDLIHPAEMTIRGFHFWQQTHWPGRNGRTHYAHTLFHVYVIRCLQFLSVRLWDEDPHGAGARLAEMQGVLDTLWRSSPAGQPAIVRDARWLIPLAQSLPTDELAPYLEVARQVAETLPEADALEVQRAHVRLLGGHLTSQIRHHCTREGVPAGEPGTVLRTRTSNALDFALLVQGLVPLLRAYDGAVQTGDGRMRLSMAGAICQGISPDPELFLHRIDLLSAYTMIEHVFIADGRHSPSGLRHVRLLQEYGEFITRLIGPLRDDFPRFRPVAGGCSPFGVVFGYPSNLTEIMALKTLEREAETRFSLEDAFDDGDTGAAKLAWVDGWRKMPHIDPEVQRLYDYPQQFAEEIYGRIECEIGGHGSKDASCDSPTGRLYVVAADAPDTNANVLAIPELPARYFVSSDKQMVAAHRAEPCDRAQLQHERREAHFLASYETPGGWMALKKDLLTVILGAGRDARIAGLPPAAAQVLRLMCGGLVVPESAADRT